MYVVSLMFFLKKYNIWGDRLIRRFDFRNSCYYYTKMENGIFVEINYDQLDRQSKKQLLLENKELLMNKDKLENIVNTYRSAERSNYLKSIGFSCHSTEWLGPVEGTISDSLNDYLDNLLSEENVLIGIHRVGNYFSQEMIDDIFNNGLIMTGDITRGFCSSVASLDKNIGYYSDNKIIKKELMYADTFKNSVGSILIRIPDASLERNDDIMIEFEGITRLNPKYIVGYVPVYSNHHIDDIYFNPYFEYECDNEFISK